MRRTTALTSALLVCLDAVTHACHAEMVSFEGDQHQVVLWAVYSPAGYNRTPGLVRVPFGWSAPGEPHSAMLSPSSCDLCEHQSRRQACRCGRFAVLNDFEAVGYGVPVVPPEDLVVLHDAPVSPKVKPTPQPAPDVASSADTPDCT